MPTDFLFPTGADLVNNGVWQQAGPLAVFINDFVPPDPPAHPPACGGGNRITAQSITPADYQVRHTDLPSGRISVNFIEAHLGGRTIGGSNIFYRFMHNDGGGLDETLLTDAFANNPLCQSNVSAPIPLNGATGQPWLPSDLRTPYMRIGLDTNGAFLQQRLLGYAHLHVDSNLGGSGGLEVIGISWLPPIIAGLGDFINLYSENWERFWRWMHEETFGCGDLPIPSRDSRKEREWLCDKLFVRPRFCFLGR